MRRVEANSWVHRLPTEVHHIPCRQRFSLFGHWQHQQQQQLKPTAILTRGEGFRIRVGVETGLGSRVISPSDREVLAAAEPTGAAGDL